MIRFYQRFYQPQKLSIGSLIFLLALAGCVAPSTIYHSPSALAPPLESSVLILPPDVVLSVLNAGGNTEPRADWSDSAQASLHEALEEFLYEHGVRFVPYQGELRDEHVDLTRQANVILDAVELGMARQSSIGGDRKYALGKGVLDSMAGIESDYALYIVLRANKASGGRTAVAVLAAIAGGSVQMGSATFRVALFDRRDGQIKWANFDPLALSDMGDMVNASPEQWAKSVQHLLREFPL